MTKMEYANELAKQVDGEVKVVEKENGVTLIGIMPKEGNLRPIYYIDKNYENNDYIKDTVKEIKKVFNSNPPNFDIDISSIDNFDNIKYRLRVRLYNGNNNLEVFESAKEYGFEDLIIVPIMILNVNNDASGIIKITKALLDKWNVSAKEVIKIAMNNSKNDYQIINILDMIPFLSEESVPMWVVTNKERKYGAISVIFAKEKLKEMFPKGYIVIPSSIHEMIVVSEEDNEIPMLNDMITHVNNTQVQLTERLSDHVYRFEV